MEGREPPETVWRPVEDLPADAARWGSAHYRERAAKWHDLRDRLQDPAIDRTLLDVWLRERNRAAPTPGEHLPANVRPTRLS